MLGAPNEGRKLNAEEPFRGDSGRRTCHDAKPNRHVIDCHKGLESGLGMTRQPDFAVDFRMTPRYYATQGTLKGNHPHLYNRAEDLPNNLSRM